MKRLLVLLAAVALVALVGCNSSSNILGGGGTDPNTAQVLQVAQTDETADPVASGVLDENETIQAAPQIGSASSLSISMLIDSTLNVCWFRRLTHTVPTWSATGDTSNKLVTFTRRNNGLFLAELCNNHGHGRDRGGRDTLLYHKPYQVTWTRQALYQKLAVVSPDSGEDDGSEITRWVLKAVSLAHIDQNADSPFIASPRIVSVTISGDTSGVPASVTFTDPTVLFDPHTLPAFAPNDSVQVTVVTDNPTAEMAFIHFDFGMMNAGGRHMALAWRRPLTFNGTAFVGSFKVRPGFAEGHFRGRRVRQAVWVDVLNKSTIYDTTAPYAADGWGLPYRFRAPRTGSTLAMQ